MMESVSIFEYFNNACEDKSLAKLEYYGTKFTVAEVLSNARKVGGFLLNEGFAGKSVGIMLPNVPEAIFTLYGCSAVGSIANLINPRLPTARLQKILTETDTKIIFLYDGLYMSHRRMLDEIGVKVVLCSPFYYRKILHPIYFFTSFGNKINYFERVMKSAPCSPIHTDGEEVVAYIHSGGTTGEPKTVKISSRALNSLARSILDTVHPTGEFSRIEDCMLMMLPIFHGFGLGVCVHTIACAFRIALEPRFIPGEAVRMIKAHRVTHLAGVPAMYRKMLGIKSLADGRLKRVTNAFAGGDTLDVNLKKRFDDLFKKASSTAEIAEGYGLSETASVVTVGRKGKIKMLSQGEPLCGNAIKITLDGKEVNRGEVGEICVKTSSLMSGYLTGDDGVIVENGEKWLRTGDLGYVDEDGSLFYKERLKRSIKIGAINIFPSEIERVVGGIEEIKACCAARAYDKNNKPYICLYVELTPDRVLSSSLVNKIKRKTEREIVRYAIPKEIHQVDEIKRTDIGKVDFAYYEIKIN
ncbi:MAG: acyl--CoA ligase [Clostridia bacterium]|nr:acyl--CoA ligase [Clostridia bacterium]